MKVVKGAREAKMETRMMKIERKKVDNKVTK